MLGDHEFVSVLVGFTLCCLALLCVVWFYFVLFYFVLFSYFKARWSGTGHSVGPAPRAQPRCVADFQVGTSEDKAQIREYHFLQGAN